MKKELTPLFMLFFLFSCGNDYKPHAFGPRDIVEVVTDTLTWSICSDAVKEALWDTRYYPSFEHVFDMEYVSPDKFWEKRTDYWRRHNLLFIVTPENREAMKEIVKDRFDFAQGIQHKKDVWASPQIVIIIEKNADELSRFIEENSDHVFDLFFSAASERIEFMLYTGGYQEKLSLALKTSYGFDIKMPYYYVVADSQGSAGNGHVIAVQHMRSGTDNALSRYVTLLWFEAPEKTELSSEAFQILRDTFASVYFGGDYCIVEDSGRDEIGHWFEGLWQNSEEGIGGPFKTWTVSEGGRTFLIDVHLFAPGNKKSFYLEELRLIAKTFKMMS